MVRNRPKTSWADEVDGLGKHTALGPLYRCPTIYLLDGPPKIEETIDENGIRTIVEYTTNEDGKRVKARF